MQIYFSDKYLYVGNAKHTQQAASIWWSADELTVRIIAACGHKICTVLFSDVTDVDGNTYADKATFEEAIDDFFVKASNDGGETPTILTQSGSNSMGFGILVRARSVTITAGTWIVTGNIFCDGDVVSSGYAKAALNLSNDTFVDNETTQIDIDSNENDFGFSVMPMYVTVTASTIIFLNFEREMGTTAVTLHSKIQAIKVG